MNESERQRDTPRHWIGNLVWPGVMSDGRRFLHGVLPPTIGAPPGKRPLAEALGSHSRAMINAFGSANGETGRTLLVGANQVHGQKIEYVDEETNLSQGVAIPGLDERFSLIEFPETDGLVARVTKDTPDVMLVIQTADCLPILFFDPATGLIGACHCGWRGLIAGLAGKTARRVIEMGADLRTLEAWIGPGIGVANYEVGSELVGRFEKVFPAVRVSPNGTHLNLGAVASGDLRRAGLGEAHVTDSQVCTYDHPEHLHSFRRDGEKAGRSLTVIGIAG